MARSLTPMRGWLVGLVLVLVGTAAGANQVPAQATPAPAALARPAAAPGRADR